MAKIQSKFIVVDTLQIFLGADYLNSTSDTTTAGSDGYVNNIPYNSVVFIKDKGTLWSHGKYFGTNISSMVGATAIGSVTRPIYWNGSLFVAIDLTFGEYVIAPASNIVYNPVTKSFTKVGGGISSWDTTVYSTSGYKECRLTYKIGLTEAAIKVGLNSDPSTDAGHGSIDYCWYMQNTTDKTLNIYESNSSISSITGHTTYEAGDEFVIEYSNGTVRYYHNGVLCRTVERAYGNPLYLDSSFNGLGYIYDVVFEPIGISLAWDNISGKPSTFTPSSHTHGNIQNGGTLQTNDVAPANGDKLVITDASDSNKVARSSISIGSAVTTQSQSTKFLREDGTWAAPSYTGVTSGYWANIGVTTSANYIKEPELKSIKINGSSTNAASTTNCSLLYDPTYKYLKFVFV